MCAASLETLLAPRSVHQNTAHRIGCGPKEVVSVVEIGEVLSQQADIGLVHQGRGLERVTGLFTGELLSGQQTQLLIHQRKQLIGGLLIALVNCA